MKRHCRIREGPTHLSLSARGRGRGGFLPQRHRWLAGKIRPAGGRWSAVEWPESKPAGWRIGLVVDVRGGLTGAGGSTVVQIEQQGATAVEQRSS